MKYLVSPHSSMSMPGAMVFGHGYGALGRK